MGPFTFKGTMLPNSASGGGNNHAGVVQYKNNWYVFYHDRRLRSTNGTSSGEYRSVSVDKLEYNADGTMKQVVSTVAGPAQLKNLNPYDTILATTIYKQSGTIKTAICSAKNPGAVGNSDKTSTTDANDPGTAGDRCVMLTSIANNNWVSLKGVDFGTTGATKFVVRAASASAGGSIEIRTGNNTGALAGTCAITATGGIATWKDIECDVSVSAGVKDSLTLVFKGTGTDQFRISKYIFKASDSTPSSSSTTPSSSSAAPSSSSSIAQSSSSVDNPTLITNQLPLTISHSPTYYSLKGEPLGKTKTQKAGIYIVKQGNSIKKIAVK
jgi:arabinoxylan arabinofuranohydrolase